MINIKNIKGTKDILPENSFNLKKLEDYLHVYMRSYGYGEIRTPVFEHTELFTRSIGNETDIVNKEMYSWIDQGGTFSSVTLSYYADNNGSPGTLIGSETVTPTNQTYLGIWSGGSHYRYEVTLNVTPFTFTGQTNRMSRHLH